MTFKMEKVVPVLLRQTHHEKQILVFRHPLAGVQIVKGTVEEHETLENAALRELAEESGIKDAHIQTHLGIFIPSEIGPHWHVFLCETESELADHWNHFCQDDGGLNFDFFWYPLNQQPTSEWHQLFVELFQYIQKQLQIK
ncbi:NUDIX domain-containing protein [Acinetobacter gerneri]|jgi:8-oxo-dGTP pyrophosphatase MutT (NUDIX family)|uniref:Nudix hydrolase domain-containing protein n=3 Tax=Acinetobacter gerneri TaxID=202952 RepID=N8ZII7_9GAMM|nr:NUDIX domain-containing protein [Acinetobacter gerneri]ENV31538.1 hypothetical protein F960_03899 [Acinetobacter gerneri DSM 14967 = CIP 107464 = MTCC 9824]MCH4245815.1 NUDIX domain-containing protein [Acinetobacter gerneri]MDQ9008373.1 NUDIX domain-containing protein [Acinetobacter gerneri]MDQ9012662.1 NUDIX domain-containing protein [Acinetobacter gerneri]MDQ9024097.1 NUDIX domain-containing protein [Acinetobacter gerneri]